MKTSKITKADIESSVLSVPPLARRADYSIDRDGNAKILAHLRAGGVKTFMYGGNANLYNMAPSEFVKLCELLIELSQPDDWMIPSVGSDFGKAQDQLTYLKTHAVSDRDAAAASFPGDAGGRRHRHPQARRHLWQAGHRLREGRRLYRRRPSRQARSRRRDLRGEIRDRARQSEGRSVPRRHALGREQGHRDLRHRRAPGDRSSDAIRTRRLHLRQRLRRSGVVDRDPQSAQARRRQRKPRGCANSSCRWKICATAFRRCACCMPPCISPALPIPARCCRISPTSPMPSSSPTSSAPPRRLLAADKQTLAKAA